MTDDSVCLPQRAVPSGRLSRIGQFGQLAAGVAGGMLAESARRLATGERPRMSDLLLTPGNGSGDNFRVVRYQDWMVNPKRSILDAICLTCLRACVRALSGHGVRSVIRRSIS